jgi:hypothetical protein
LTRSKDEHSNSRVTWSKHAGGAIDWALQPLPAHYQARVGIDSEILSSLIFQPKNRKKELTQKCEWLSSRKFY